MWNYNAFRFVNLMYCYSLKNTTIKKHRLFNLAASPHHGCKLEVFTMNY